MSMREPKTDPTETLSHEEKVALVLRLLEDESVAEDVADIRMAREALEEGSETTPLRDFLAELRDEGRL